MSERTFRIIQGIYLLFALFYEINLMIYIFIAVFTFEAVTNWRLPFIISRLRYGANQVAAQDDNNYPAKFNYEAERMLRISVGGILWLGLYMYPDLLWFVPWFIAVMLLLAGITGICAIVTFFRYFGFR